MLAALGEAHGYAIMAELKERVGGGWKPSPGAIYPALLALVESGYVRTADHDGTRVYSLTETGERAAEAQRSSSRWTSLTERAAASEDRTTIGAILDRFATTSGLRRRLAGPEQRDGSTRSSSERTRRSSERSRKETAMDEFGELAAREREAKRIARRRWFWLHLAVYVTTELFLFVIWVLSDVEFPWFLFPLFGWGILLAAHAVYAFVIKTPEEIMIERESRDERGSRGMPEP